MPNVLSRFARVGPTPGRVVTSSSSRRCGGAQPRGRGQSSWTRPVKPVCMRVIVATWTEHRTRSGRQSLLLLVQEPAEPDRTRAGVRADDGTERRRDLDLRVRPLVLDELAQRLQTLGRRGLRDADLQV